MKVLVTGASGLLGRDVWSTFGKDHDLIGIGRQVASHVPTAQWRTCDLTDTKRTIEIVTKENPDLVVHTAAFNQVDLAESNPDAAFRGNAVATRNLALACQRFDTVLLSVSTDYVFDGEHAPSDGYREFDTPRPISAYGESKYAAELAVKELLNKFYVVRTSLLFGPGRPTWVDLVRDHGQKKKPITAVTDMTSCPTYTPHLAKALLQLAESGHYGTYHLTNTGFCHRDELAEEVLRLFDVPSKELLKRTTRKSLHLAAPRPSFSALDNAAWRCDGFAPLPSWQAALEEHFQNAKVSL